MNPSSPVTWRTHYALVVLACIYVFNYIDRQLMAILIEPVKLEFGISDTGIGLLSGVTFAVFYTVFGLPLGRLSDRIGRKPVIAFSCMAWSLMTMLCGLAGNFLTGSGNGGTCACQSHIAALCRLSVGYAQCRRWQQ